MKSELPKVMHRVCGVPMLLHVLEAAAAVQAQRTVVVLGHGSELVVPRLPAGCVVAIQDRQKGTGHALLAAEEQLPSGPVVVLPGDTPLITGGALDALVTAHVTSGAVATVLTMVPEDPTGYGRIVRDEKGAVMRIVEHRDATPEERAVKEVNTGMYVLPLPRALEILRTVGAGNDQGEIYLTDVIAGLVSENGVVAAVQIDDARLALGVNSPVELAEAEAIMGGRIKQEWMCRGVTIVDPRSTVIEAQVVLEPGTVLRPFTSLCGSTKVGAGCEIGPCSTLVDADVGGDCRVPHCFLREAMVAAGTTLAPFTTIDGIG